VRQGTARARTQEIAAEAGVNKALVHYYFGTKDKLAEAVLEDAARDFIPRIFAIIGSETMGLEAKIRAVVQEQVAFHTARPYVAGYLLAEAHTEPERLQALFARSGPAPLGVLRRQLAHAAAAGEIRKISAEQFVVSLMGLLVFPFAARPILALVVGLDDARFASFIETRRRELPGFLLAALRP